MATMEARASVYDQSDATGFIRLNALRLKLQGKRKEALSARGDCSEPFTPRPPVTWRHHEQITPRPLKVQNMRTVINFVIGNRRSVAQLLRALADLID